MRAATQYGDGAPGGNGALRDQLSTAAAEAGNHAVDQRIIGGAVDLGNGNPILDGGEHSDFPVGDVAGEDDHPAPCRNCAVHMFEAERLDAPVGIEDSYFPRCGYSAMTRPRLSHIPAT